MNVIIINGVEYVPLVSKEKPKSDNIQKMMKEIANTHFNNKK